MCPLSLAGALAYQSRSQGGTPSGQDRKLGKDVLPELHGVKSLGTLCKVGGHPGD